MGTDGQIILSSGLFDVDYYLSQCTSDLQAARLDPVQHYISLGSRKGFNPSPYFDVRFYLNEYQDLAIADIEPLMHYIQHGRSEGRYANKAEKLVAESKLIKESGLFDPEYYLAFNPEASASDPVVHYLTRGWLAGRNPSVDFDVRAYLSANLDVARTGMDPLVHYIRYGIEERRRVRGSDPVSDLASLPAFELRDFRQTTGLERSGTDYVAIGADPQIEIDLDQPRGFLRFSAEILFEVCDQEPKTQNFLQLILGNESEYWNDSSWRYAISSDRLVVEDIIFAPRPVQRARLHPINRQGRLSILSLSLSPVPERLGLRVLLDRGLSRDPWRRSDELFIFRALLSTTLREIGVRLLSKSLSPSEGAYLGWVENRRIGLPERTYLEQKLEAMSSVPLFSVLMLAYMSNLNDLEKSVKSVQEQVFTGWELCIVDNGSKSEELTNALESLATADPRIKVVSLHENIGTSQATNRALEVASGDFILLINQEDGMQPHALYAFADAIRLTPDADMVYSDEDKLGVDGGRFDPFFKPDWSADFLLSCMYTGQLVAYRTSLIREVGGFRAEFDMAQDYDLALRVSERAKQVVHVPDVLYHRLAPPSSAAGQAEGNPQAELAARRAVAAAVDRRGLAGRVVPGPLPGTHRVQPDLTGGERVSIVIPTAARRIESDIERWYLLDLIRSIYEIGTYSNLEVIVIHNGDIEPTLQRLLKPFPLVFLHYECIAFNFSEKLNQGVESATGEFVVLMNDDMSVIAPSWIEEMLLWAKDPGVAGVGAKLLFPDRTVQHAGVVMLGQGPSHIFYGEPEGSPGLAGSAVLVRNYSAVTGACLMVRRDTYVDLGGFDPYFKVNYNDVDFCMKLGRLGRIVFTPYALLYHYESVSKGQAPPGELERFMARWPALCGADPMYNRNLSQTSSSMEVDSEPRSFFSDY